MYLSCITLRNSSELIAYYCMPKASMYNILKSAGLYSPANKFSCEEVTLWISCTVLISFSKVSALYIPYINIVLSNFITLLHCILA